MQGDSPINEQLNRHRILITALCAVILFSVMNAGMFQVALPLLAQDYGLEANEVSWVVTGYIVIYAIGSLLYGKLADKYPIRRLLLVGVGVFVAGSVIGLIAGETGASFGWIVLARLIQSAGASAVPATAMIIPSRFVAPEERGKALGTISSTVALGTGVGPLVSGALTGWFGWPSLFLISLGVIVMMPFLMRAMPVEQPKGTTVDGVGAAGVALAVAGLMLAISMAGTIYLLLTIAGVIVAWLAGRKHPMPFLPVKMFGAYPVYSQALGGSFLAAGTLFGLLIVIPLMLQERFGLSPEQIGMTMFPSAIIAALSGRFAGVQVDRLGSRTIVMFALGLLIAGYGVLAVLGQVHLGFVIGGLLLAQFGFAWVQPALSKQVSVSVPPERTGIAFGVFTLTTFMSGAIAGSVCTRLLTSMDALGTFEWAGWNLQGKYVVLFAGLAFVALSGWLWMGRKVHPTE